MALSQERLTEIRARLEAATPGPWRVWHRAVDRTEHDDQLGLLGLDIAGPPEPARGRFARAADAQLIAHAPADLRDLLAHTEERDRALAEADARVAWLLTVIDVTAEVEEAAGRLTYAEYLRARARLVPSEEG